MALFSGRGWIVVYEGRRHEVLELRISRNRFLAVCLRESSGTTLGVPL